jgi:membrane protein implicated in regulation of membrane protease activity
LGRLVPSVPIFIPILIGAGAVATAAAGARLVWKAKKRISAAKARLRTAEAEYKRHQAEYTDKGREAEQAFADLGEAKLHALKTLGEAAKILRNAKVRDREKASGVTIDVPQLAQWESASLNATDALKGLGSGGLIGASTAAGVYGLVGLLGTASTGTAISTLTGIAASNATLAWLGGGAIAVGGGGVAVGTCLLGGVVAGPVVLATGIGLSISAAKFQTKVEKRMAEMGVAQEEMKNRSGTLDQVIRRASELAESIRRTERAVADLMQEATGNATREAYDLFKTAKTLSDFIDTALMDRDGRPTF